MRRSIDWVLVRLILTGVFVLALPVGGVATARRLDDRPRLRGELERIIALVDATDAAVAAGREGTLRAPNADPRHAGDPNAPDANLYGMTPGYTKCDGSWRDRLLPGWQAGHNYAYVIEDRADGDALILATSDHWRSLGIDVTVEHRRDGSQVRADLEHTTIMLTVSYSTPAIAAGTGFSVNQASLMGFTNCLPTG